MGMRVSPIHRLCLDKLLSPGHSISYRNFLMACTALMDQPFQPMYFPLLDEPVPPSIRNFQSTIEDAWKAGQLSPMCDIYIYTNLGLQVLTVKAMRN